MTTCGQLLGVVDWPQLIIAVTAGFTSGGLLGFLAGRHHPHDKNAEPPSGTRKGQR